MSRAATWRSNSGGRTINLNDCPRWLPIWSSVGGGHRRPGRENLLNGSGMARRPLRRNPGGAAAAGKAAGNDRGREPRKRPRHRPATGASRSRGTKNDPLMECAPSLSSALEAKDRDVCNAPGVPHNLSQERSTAIKRMPENHRTGRIKRCRHVCAASCHLQPQWRCWP